METQLVDKEQTNEEIIVEVLKKNKRVLLTETEMKLIAEELTKELFS